MTVAFDDSGLGYSDYWEILHANHIAAPHHVGNALSLPNLFDVRDDVDGANDYETLRWDHANQIWVAGPPALTSGGASITDSDFDASAVQNGATAVTHNGGTDKFWVRINGTWRSVVVT